MRRKIYHMYLKFIEERESHFKFCRRHPQISFLGSAFLIGTIACQSILANTTVIPESETTVFIDTVSVSTEADSFGQLALTSGDEHLEILQDALPAAIATASQPPDASISNSITTASENFSDAITDVVTNAADELVANADAASAELLPILDIPFSTDVQQQILDEACNGDLRMFCLVMTIAKKESEFRPNLIGDNGLSYGTYQIKTDCHAERIAKFGFTKDDLFDPVKGAIVCADYLRELMWTYQKSGDVSHFLFMMYNQGPSSARGSIKHMVNSTEYSRKAMSIYATYLAEVGLEAGVPIAQ